MQLNNLKAVTEMLEGAHTDLADDNDRAAVYIRVCLPDEQVSDLLSEAAAHGCILAVKGGTAVIMPELVEGWTKVRGGWMVLQ